jgi:hypothetical protein
MVRVISRSQRARRLMSLGSSFIGTGQRRFR